MKLRSTGRTDRGRVRNTNQDAFAILESAQVYAVADGMGGHAEGGAASRLLVSAIVEHFERGAGDPTLPEAVERANEAVWQMAADLTDPRGTGSTVVAALFEGDVVTISHVGDSRCYVLRGGEIRQLTLDHSMIEQLREGGQTVVDDDLVQRYGHILSRAIGRGPTCDVATAVHQVHEGDLYLLCSDGLTRMVDDATILSIVQASASLENATEALVNAANDAGGADNVTVLLVAVDAL